MDEVYIVTVRGERRYLWRAVDHDGDVLDVLVQERKDKQAAVRFFKKLMKGQGRFARLMITDRLPSYGAARKAVMSTSMHRQERYANNRAAKKGHAMKAAVYNDYAAPVEIAEIERPELQDGSVLIEVHAASLNPIDNILRAGYLREMLELSFPHVMGYDVSGTVVEVGKDVRNVEVGDEVFARPNQEDAGAIAEFARLQESELAIKPANLSHQEACAPQKLHPHSRGLRFEAVLMLQATEHGMRNHLESDRNEVPVESWLHPQVSGWVRNPWSDRHVWAPAGVMDAPQLEDLPKVVLSDRHDPVERRAA